MGTSLWIGTASQSRSLFCSFVLEKRMTRQPQQAQPKGPSQQQVASVSITRPLPPRKTILRLAMRCFFFPLYAATCATQWTTKITSCALRMRVSWQIRHVLLQQQRTATRKPLHAYAKPFMTCKIHAEMGSLGHLCQRTAQS